MPINFGRLGEQFGAKVKEVAASDAVQKLRAQANELTTQAVAKAQEGVAYIQSEEGKQKMTDAVNATAGKIGEVVAVVDEKIKAPETQAVINSARKGLHNILEAAANATEVKPEEKK